ncbi:MAG: phosphate butyryltransferase [Muribaculaceae bacterium]|nr:phosphate butyryltransferase [Muribaculaceae bacterium]
METDQRLEMLVERARSRRLTVAVAWPADKSTLGAVKRAVENGFINAIMLGCADKVQETMGKAIEEGHVTLLDVETPAEAATKAVEVVNRGEAQLLMKGLVSTDVVLRAVLNKETGLLDPGNVLTHISIGDIPTYNKLLCFGDVAVMPNPNVLQRTAQLRYILDMCRSLGIEEPRVSLVHCSEHVDAKHFPCTIDYVELVKRSREGEFGACIVDGPLDVKTSCCLEAAVTKGIDSPLQGQADALIFPEIESGNAFYKTVTLFAGATIACVVLGARVPLVVSSRGDDEMTKYYSIAAACCAAKKGA